MRRGMRAGWYFCMFVCAVAFCSCFLGVNARAEKADDLEQPELSQTEEELGLTEELKGLQQFLDSAMGQDETAMGHFSFGELMGELAAGHISGILSQTGQAIKGFFTAQVAQGSRLLAQVAAIGILGAVFSNLSSVFKNGQLSDTGFYVTYLLLFTCLAGSFLASLQIASQVLGQILEFMRALMPAYFMTVAFTGGALGAAALYEGLLAAVTAVQWLCGGLLLSGVKVYVLLVLGDHVMKEPMLSRLSELVEQAVSWSLKMLLGLVLGFQLLQSMILPYADGVGQTGLRRLVELIPGIGQGAGAAAKLVLGSGVLIKNSLGGAAVVVLAALSLVPVLKLTVLMFMYQAVAAVMQPVCDKRMVSCVHGISRGHRMLLEIVLYSLFLFIVTIGIICVSTNVNYLAL